MKTLTALTLATVMTLGAAAPVQANTITDTLTDIVSMQLAELSANIKQQAQSALEKTAAELFFANGAEQAQQNLTKVTPEDTNNQANTDKE